MSPLPEGVRRAFRLAVRRPAIEQDVNDEVAFHLEMRAAELVARGLSPDEARAEATRRFGNPAHWSSAMREEDRDRVARERRAEWFGDLAQDVRFALRSFRRAPLFSALAVLTLALGIGANAAVFGVVKSVLLDALPYREPERVVRVYGRMLDGSTERAPTSAGIIMDLREQGRSFASVAGLLSIPQEGVLMADGAPQLVKFARTEPELFATLGVTPAAGRVLQAEDAVGDTAYSAVLTHDGWQRLLGGAADPVGQKVVVNGIPRTVVGVLPQAFVGPIGDVDLYLPMSLRPYMANVVNARMRQNFAVVGRLRPGVTMETADREVTAVIDDARKRFPRETGVFGLDVVPMQDALVGDTRTPLLVLMGSAALVLLITCANLAGALVSRTISRRKEFAIRVALGAGRGRLVRQLLTESTLLALAGGVGGVVLAWGGLALLRGLAAHALPEYARLTLDPSALLVTAIVALVTGLLFGAAPALSVGRADPQRTLRDETRGASESPRSRRLRGVLVAGQIALCVSLLAGAGLLARSLIAMTSAPLGFRTDGLLTATVFVPNGRYAGNEARAGFYQALEKRLRAIPGVTRAATMSAAPTRVQSRNGFRVVGAPPLPADQRPLALYMDVSDDYFRTMGIPMKAGRAFGSEERPGGPLGIIINEALARQYFPGGNAVGARVSLGPEGSTDPDFLVVGVAADTRNDPALADPQPVLYLSNKQFPWNGPVIALRTGGDPLTLVEPLRRAVAELDPTVPIYDIETVEGVVSDGLAGRRLPVVLMSAFGALALILASVGVYAMFAAMAAAREREFAVRVALGSSRGAIAGLVLRQGGVWMLAGLLVGAAGVVAVSRAVQSLLYGVGPFDPIAFGAAALLLVLFGAVALMIPVRRATRADPMLVLR